MYVNLLPPELVAQSRLIQATRHWVLVIAMWAITLVAVSAPESIRAFKLQQDLQQLHSEVSPIRLKESKTRQLHAITADLKKRSQRIRAVLPPNRIPSLLGIFGKTLQSKDSPIALRDLTVMVQSDLQNKKSSKTDKAVSTDKTDDTFPTHVIARGYTGSNPTVAEVIQRLEEFGVFQTILLKSARDSVVANQQVDEFELECGYAE